MSRGGPAIERQHLLPISSPPLPRYTADLIPHMSKKFKSQASSSRAAGSAFGSFGGFSGSLQSQGKEPSTLTYITAPPDLSRITDQQLVIAFKNLLKKDDTTRTKALEELRDHISTVQANKGTLDDGFLDAWVYATGHFIHQHLLTDNLPNLDRIIPPTINWPLSPSTSACPFHPGYNC